ncbi:hypothetical protein [Rhodoligotrophos ferricapiens]|uniref:hypothetical protein n=1 Tax=Rhodoligotrophos ferricapiens TaxID=3069264 RepID=UPI00315D0B03
MFNSSKPISGAQLTAEQLGYPSHKSILGWFADSNSGHVHGVAYGFGGYYPAGWGYHTRDAQHHLLPAATAEALGAPETLKTQGAHPYDFAHLWGSH